jgi:endonuclease-3
LRAADAVDAVDRALASRFGTPRKEEGGDPLSGLVQTILSQNTNDGNRDRAFASLKKAFPTWEAVLKAGPGPLEAAIRVGGLSRVKAGRIVGLLQGLQETGQGLTLDGLRGLSPQEAEERLLAMRGVGRKTARCVMLFQLGMEAFPVDTHILRVSRRLGWVPPQATADRAHEILQVTIPGERMHSLHVNMIRLGRAFCRPRGPRCGACPVQPWCPSGGKWAPPSPAAAGKPRSERP